MAAPSSTSSFGGLLRQWRQRRRFSQLELANQANVSSRHLSFIETGRAQPSRDMVLLLAQHLDVPLRSRNLLLGAAGYAPAFQERELENPSMQGIKAALEALLTSHEPFPALVMDRHWNLVMHNQAVPKFLQGVAAQLLEPPVNLIRLSLHPAGLAKRIMNLGQWRNYFLERLQRQIEVTDDPVLQALLAEVFTYSVDSTQWQASDLALPSAGVIMPFRLATEWGELTFFSTTMVFGTPLDITLSELAIESFLPANAITAEVLRRLHAHPLEVTAQ